jgi:predicted site-specific integrase-resolvase
MCEKLYTLKEAKRLLGVTTWTIQQWNRSERLDVLELLVRVSEGEIKRILGSKEEA